MCDYDDGDSIKGFLQDKYRQWKEGDLCRGPLKFPKFERETLAGELAEKLNELVPAPLSRRQSQP